MKVAVPAFDVAPGSGQTRSDSANSSEELMNNSEGRC